MRYAERVLTLVPPHTACAPGCTACASGSGACSTCAAGLPVSSDDARNCITARFLPSNGTAFTSCQTGFYLSDSSAGSCTACNAACGECFGPGQDNCLSCPAGRGVLQGVCVAVDANTGICDGSAVTSTNALAWVYNNEKKECDRESEPLRCVKKQRLTLLTQYTRSQPFLPDAQLAQL